MDVEERLKIVRDRQTEAQRRIAAVDAKLDQIRAQRESLLATLQTHGFDNAEEAKKHISTLQVSIEDILSDIESKVSGL